MVCLLYNYQCFVTIWSRLRLDGFVHYYIECEITYKISDDKEVKQKQSNTSSNSSSSKYYMLSCAI